MALLIAVVFAVITLRSWYVANNTLAYWIAGHERDQAHIDAITSAIVKANDMKAKAIDEGVKNSTSIVILGEDNRGLDGSVDAIFEDEKLVLITVVAGSGDKQVTIHYYLENERDPMLVTQTEQKHDGPVPHKETYGWYFVGGEYVKFQFSNPEEEKKFSPLDRPEDISDIRRKIAGYLRILGLKESQSAVPRNA